MLVQSVTVSKSKVNIHFQYYCTMNCSYPSHTSLSGRGTYTRFTIRLPKIIYNISEWQRNKKAKKDTTLRKCNLNLKFKSKIFYRKTYSTNNYNNNINKKKGLFLKFCLAFAGKNPRPNDTKNEKSRTSWSHCRLNNLQTTGNKKSTSNQKRWTLVGSKWLGHAEKNR